MRINGVRLSAVFVFVLALASLAAFAASSEVIPMLSFGDPVASGSTLTIPIYLDAASANDVSAWAICIRAPKDVLTALNIRRPSDSNLQPAFETTARNAESVTYVAWSSESIPAGVLHVADVEVPANHAGNLHLEFDKQLTTVSDKGGLQARTAVNGALKLDSPIDTDNPGIRRRVAK